MASCMRAMPWPHDPVAARAPAAAAPKRHVDRFDLALGVHAHAVDRRQAAGHALEQFGERQHRVAGEEPAAGRDGRLGHRVAALQQGGCVTIPDHLPWACRTCTPRSSSPGTRRGRPGRRCSRRQQREAVADVVGRRRHDEHARPAGRDAQLAALAALDVDDDGAAGDESMGRPRVPLPALADRRRRRRPRRAASLAPGAGSGTAAPAASWPPPASTPTRPVMAA